MTGLVVMKSGRQQMEHVSEVTDMRLPNNLRSSASNALLST